MGRPSRYSPEVRERAVRMVFEHEDQHDSQWARDPVRRREDRVFIGNAPTLGAASGTGSGPSPGVDDRRAGAVESTGA